MAPKKPKPPTKPVSKDRVAKNVRVAKHARGVKNAREAKRPLRGFHTFKDGSLNVSPKSTTEKRLCTENQENSPLLRLPPEIRNMIWKYALGGKTFIARGCSYKHKENIANARLTSSRNDPKNGLALLSTCKQIFRETAPYPLTHGSIHYEIKWLWVNTTRALMAHQRDCVKRIVISYPSLDYGPGIASLERVSSRLPALDEVEILFHDIAKPSFDGSDFQSKKEATTERLTRGVEELGFSFKVKVSGTKETMESFWADI